MALARPWAAKPELRGAQRVDGQTEFDVEANTVRRLVAGLGQRFPGLGHQIDEGMAAAINGEIYQESYLEHLKPDSEVVLILKIGGG